MPRLTTLTIGTPGFRGLNKQQAGSVLPPGWGTIVNNFVIDDQGRLAVRNGTRAVSTGGIPGATSIQVAHYYLDNNGTEVLIAAAVNKLWRLDGTSWTDVTGTATPTADNWQFVNFNGKVIGVQEGHVPIVMATTAGTFAPIVASSGTVPQGRAVLSAYSRLWIIDKDTLYFSDLLDETGWAAGTAGSLLLNAAWPKGVDTPVALADFNGFLSVFGETQIILYQGPDDPTSPFSSFALVEGVSGLGCIARDSVQTVGRDIVFLSGNGLRTLGRVIQEKSMPITDAAPQVRDFLLQQAADGPLENIKSAFAQFHGFYVLILANTVLVFDLRVTLEDGSFKVTEWVADYVATAANKAGKLVLSIDDDMFRYEGRKDKVTSGGTGGETIRVEFEGVWNDFDRGDGVGERVKHLKRVKLFINGGAGQLVAFRWAVDYKTTTTQRNIQIPAGKDEARWGVARYSVDHYSGDFSFNTGDANASRSGQVVKVGLITDVKDVPFALDRITIFATVGKLAL